MRTRYKETVLIFMVILFFVLKISPFYFEKKAEMMTTGEDYNLNKAAITLDKIFNNNDKILTNIHCYKVYYYALWYMIPNDDIKPEFRMLPEKFPTLCYRYNQDDKSSLDNIDRDNFYILSVNEKNTNSVNINNFLDQNKNRISLVADEKNSSNEILWSIWKYEK